MGDASTPTSTPIPSPTPTPEPTAAPAPAAAPVAASTGTERWIDVGGVAELRRRRKIVVPAGDADGDGSGDGDGDGEADGDGAGSGEVLVLLHDGAVHAFDNQCIHRQRELVKGTVLNGRLVCPGHQWAFELGTGWEAVKGECQPTYDVRIEGDRVLLDLASRARRAPITRSG